MTCHVPTRAAPIATCRAPARGVLSRPCVIVARILRCYVALGLRVGATIAVPAGLLCGRDGTMSTHDSPLPLDDADFAPIEKALQTAYDELERLARSLRDVVSAYNHGTTPDPLPT